MDKKTLYDLLQMTNDTLGAQLRSFQGKHSYAERKQRWSFDELLELIVEYKERANKILNTVINMEKIAKELQKLEEIENFKDTEKN